MDKNKSLSFWEIFGAVFLALWLFDWLKTHPEPLIEPVYILVLVIGCVVISVAISQWKERKWWKEHEKQELEFVRSQGYESWAEYMVDHGDTEEVRKSWEEEALKKKRKRKTS